MSTTMKDVKWTGSLFSFLASLSFEGNKPLIEGREILTYYRVINTFINTLEQVEIGLCYLYIDISE